MSWAIDKLSPRPAPPPTERPPGKPPDDRYAAKALEDETAAVAAAAPGTRNDRLNDAAFNLGTLAGAGALTEEQVVGELLAAADACGLVGDDGRRPTEQTIQSGFRAGVAKPRVIPESNGCRPADPSRQADRPPPPDRPPDEQPAAAPEPASGDSRQRLRPGGAFLFDETEGADVALLGAGDQVLHCSGEATFVVAQTGAGKSTFAQNYVCARVGAHQPPVLLGLPVRPLNDGEAILYVAADRPKQIRRSLRRMVGPSDRALLDRRLLVWEGPLPYLLNQRPTALLDHVRQLERDTGVRIVEVILYSLKDVALELSKDEGGSGVALAINYVIADSLDVLVLHHERKAERGAKKAPAEIGDVYGSAFLTACAGNVIYLYGPSGAHVVELRHLKQSADEVGPLTLIHDHDTGRFSVQQRSDLLAALRASGRGLTIGAACALMYGTDDPDRNTKERGRRALERLVKAGQAHRSDPVQGFSTAVVYHAVTTRSETS